jgi:putative addiction module CopG family antidote
LPSREKAPETVPAAVEKFIADWSGREGGQEHANYQIYLDRLCTVLNLPPPEPAEATRERNDYVFERAVDFKDADGTESIGRIDLYKRGSFVLEAKQSRLKGGKKEIENRGRIGVRHRFSTSGRQWRPHTSYDKVCAIENAGASPMSEIERLTVTLPADMAALVKQAVAGGDYASASEIVREALRDWEVKAETRRRKLDALRGDIDEGLEDVAKRRLVKPDLDDIMARGRRREGRRKAWMPGSSPGMTKKK